MNIKFKDIEIIRDYLSEFEFYLKYQIIDKIQLELRHIPKVLEIKHNLICEAKHFLHFSIYDEAGKPKYYFDEPEFIKVDDEYLPVICRSILYCRKNEAERLEDPLSKTNNIDLINIIRSKLVSMELLIKETWFQNTIPWNIPSFSEYLTNQCIDQRLKTNTLVERIYDEKFKILMSPQVFYKDIRYYKEMCYLHNSNLIVGYIDIDNFKDFNSKYTESIVDKNLLPNFMMLLSRYIYSHGYAYRYGGDEYAIIIPNFDIGLAEPFLKGFQDKLASLQFQDIDTNPTISIGLYNVTKDCIYTEREIEQRANEAKNIAKKNGKNQINVYKE